MGVFEWLRGALTAQQNYPMQYGQRPSSGVSQQGFSPQYGQSLSVGVAPPTPTFFGVHNGPNVGPDGLFMPKFDGRDICDWVDDIAALKRSGDLSQALHVARGCMDAMIAAARLNPVNVAEYYVNQVAIIQHKQKDYWGEAETIERWLALGLPAPREDFRLELRKRLAKAREMLAKQRGEDPSQHHAEWKRFVELEKVAKAAQKGSAPVSVTGRAAVSPDVSYARPHSRQRSSWVAPPEVLALPSFVAVDFETANRQGGESACQIALVKISGGRVVERASTLIKPPRALIGLNSPTCMGSLRATCVGPRCGQILLPGWLASTVDCRCSRIMRPLTLGCGGNSMPSSGRSPSRRASSVPIEQRSAWSLAWRTTSYRLSRRRWCLGSRSSTTERILMRRPALSWSQPCNPGGDVLFCARKAWIINWLRPCDG